MNESNPKKIYYTKSKIHNRGIFAKQQMKRGEVVCIIQGPIMFKVNQTQKDALANPDWVGFKTHYWIDPVPPYKYLNHSCDPNTAIRGNKSLVAIRTIRKGEEITIDYSIIEIDTRWQMKCSCGSKKCRKIIRSIQALPEKIFSHYLPFISKDFQKVYYKSEIL